MLRKAGERKTEREGGGERERERLLSVHDLAQCIKQEANSAGSWDSQAVPILIIPTPPGPPSWLLHSPLLKFRAVDSHCVQVLLRAWEIHRGCRGGLSPLLCNASLHVLALLDSR